MSKLSIRANGKYTGLSIFKSTTEHIEECIDFYRNQTVHDGKYSGATVIEMLNKLEKDLRLELE